MADSTQFEPDERSPSEKFAAHMHVLRKRCRSFAACVREEYPKIELSILDDVPLEEIAHSLSQNYGIPGSPAALKSALHRIRRMREGEFHRQWYDRVTQEQRGVSALRTGPHDNAYPANGQMLPQNPQGCFPYGTPVPQHLPGAAMPAAGGGFQVPIGSFPHYSHQPMPPQQNTGSPPNWYPALRNDPFDINNKF
ncbi:hypothetical protein LGM63_14205 [Burkholderia cepacia]|uniref:hypothetical protein n=1 Tax=Burkholderia cepacia TaxID=292 RepID=UPI001CF2C37D|nr:hypothetical protein [Burkholderia cepacia]MCA7991794.1 hypothetical protein [Burkholderia cepacia]